MADLLPLEQAQSRLLALAPALPVIDAPLHLAAGRWLAGDLVARTTNPPADVSAMDGWAIRFADLHARWRIVGESAAGAPFAGSLGVGETARIFTGAYLPAGADTVVLQEEVATDGHHAWFTGDGPGARGRHVRPQGGDFMQGAQLAAAGSAITAALIGLAAAAGHATLPVRAAPRIALLATGDELVPAGTIPPAGGIISSNGPMLAAMLAGVGTPPNDLGIVPDRLDRLADALDQAFATHDLVVTMGGASVGDHDLIRPALQQLGVDIAFWRLAIRPGKPLLAARKGEALLLGLPGNPVSAFVCAHLLLLPLVRHMLGSPQPLPPMVAARLAAPLGANGPRRNFLRARLADGEVAPHGVQDSAMLAALASANALIVRPEHAPAMAAGASVSVLTL